MKEELLPEDRTVLIFARERLTGLRKSLNQMSDEYSLMSKTSLAIGEAGSRLNTVLVALDEVLDPD